MSAAKMQRTSTPGIYRRGSRYIIAYRAAGKQRWESFRTLDEARRAKAARVADIARGEFQERTTVTLHVYAREWVERGSLGIREVTRDEYRRQLEQYALGYFPERLKLSDLSPARVAAFIAWLCDGAEQAKHEHRRAVERARKAEKPEPQPLAVDATRTLSDATVRRIMAPLRACLASAVDEGLIRSNPASGRKLPTRPNVTEDHEDVRALSREQLDTLLAIVPDAWRLFFTLLASTGLRVSEAIALRWGDLRLDGSHPHVKVRRASVRGRVGPPKSRHGRRDVPIDFELARALRAAREGAPDDALVFTAGNGSQLIPANVRNRVLSPASEEADLAWVGFHTFRHTCASLLFAEGRNAVQVQRWLGHHSPAFTLSTYVHLLQGDLGEPLSIGGAQPDRNSKKENSEKHETAASLS